MPRKNASKATKEAIAKDLSPDEFEALAQRAAELATASLDDSDTGSDDSLDGGDDGSISSDDDYDGDDLSDDGAGDGDADDGSDADLDDEVLDADSDVDPSADADDGSDPTADDGSQDPSLTDDIPAPTPDQDAAPAADGDPMPDNTQPAVTDDDEKNGQSGAPVAKAKAIMADLKKAVDELSRDVVRRDPSLKKEALMAKELKGSPLTKSERAELVSLIGGAVSQPLTRQVTAAQAPSQALQKAMVANATLGVSYDNITRALLAQSEHIEKSTAGIESTAFLTAKLCKKLASVVELQNGEIVALRKSIDSMGRQPAGAPRSQGLDYARKNFGGTTQEETGGSSAPATFERLHKAGHGEVLSALDALIKQHGIKTQLGQAFVTAKDAIAIGRPIMPGVASHIEAHLAAK